MRPQRYLAFVLLLWAGSVCAQDRIYRKHGSPIDVIVKKVNAVDISYSLIYDPDMNELSIPKDKVIRIVYSNGTIDSFVAYHNRKKYPRPMSNGPAPAYASNIISIIPFAYTAQLDGTINDPAVGLCYEKLFGSLGHFSIVLPVMINFRASKDFDNSNSYNVGGMRYYGNRRYSSFSVMPGFRFYPVRKNNRVRYAIGASVFAMWGSEPYYGYDLYGNVSQLDHRYQIYGFMVTNTLSIFTSGHICFSVDLDGGIPVKDGRFPIEFANNINGGVSRIVQCSVKIGYCFK